MKKYSDPEMKVILFDNKDVTCMASNIAVRGLDTQPVETNDDDDFEAG